MEKAKPRINKKTCGGCSVCVETCPMECISLCKPAFRGDIAIVAEVDRKKCIGCGLCAQVCPINAIEMKIGEGVTINMKTSFAPKKVYYRVAQFVMRPAIAMVPWKTPKLTQGPGCVKLLPGLINRRGYKKPLVVTDPTLIKLGLLDGFLRAMKDFGVEYILFSEVAPNPTDENVEAGLALYKAHGCDSIVAFGGGAPMDCAKAIGARVARPRMQVKDMQGLFRVLHRIPTIFAVPTTAGTGSETTVAAVIIESATHHKASINDVSLVPKYAFLDSELTKGLPPKVTATTGMDALCHAVEAYTNQYFNSDYENELCKRAVKLIYENLYQAYQHGDDLVARQNMQEAAFAAGRAFTRGCVGYVHAIGHTLSGLYGTPHGLTMSILLPNVMRAFGPAVHDRLAELSDLCGMTAPEASNAQKAEAFISWMEALKEKMDIPRDLHGMVKEEDVEQMAAWAEKEANPTYPVPVLWSKKEFVQFIHSLM